MTNKIANKIKKILIFIFIFSFIFSENICLSIYAAYKPSFETEAKGCYLFNIDTETVLFEKNKDLKLAPASLVTIMTAIVVLEKIKDIDKTTAVAKGYIFDDLYGKAGATAGILRGEELTIRQLLECMLTQSACEAAMILADAICEDDISAFVDLMNNKAKALGAKNTCFTTPHGLNDDENEYSTAYDMFLITRYAMELPAFMDIVSQTAHEIPATNKRNSFSVFTTIEPMKKSSKYYYPPIRGIKTGTQESGRSFVSSATKDGFTYMCCVLGAPYKNEKTGKIIAGNKAFEETIKLYDWAFDNFKLKTVLTPDSPATEISLKYAFNKDHLKLSTEKNILVLVPDSADISQIKTEYNLPEVISAPITKGEILGTAKMTLNGSDIAWFNLVSFENVDRSWPVYILSSIKNLMKFLFFRIFIIILILILFLLIIILYFRSKNKKLRSKSKLKSRKKINKKNNIFR
ncbi:MAG: D-alanyl-D-alanine carboxypeptidase [Oscillospiraceae bacterium]|nr:D-alanyl-D-alanine carboxypeptidase [Oscillospiraceae bacterium]